MLKMTVVFGPDQAEAIDRLVEQTGQTKVNVIRFAVRLMQIAVNESNRGNAVGIVRGEKVVKELAGIWRVSEPAQNEMEPVTA